MSPEVNYSSIFDKSAQKADFEIKMNKEIKTLKSEMKQFVAEYVDNRIKSKPF